MALRAISPAVAVLILIGVAIAVGILTGVIALSQTKSLASKGATIQVLVDARDAGGGSASISVTIKNAGPEDVIVDNVVVRANGAAVTCTWQNNPIGATVRSGASASFNAICSGVSVGQTISVQVDAHTRNTNTNVGGTGSTEVLP
ncbi:MAG TPA: hypothetical protein EYP33_03390 [Pyrodictium sp.]|nr:hypothetical protein [Pyrodictium sp.]